MEANRNCPFCNKRAKLESCNTVKEFKKEKFKLREFYYKCDSCGEEFTTTKTDEVTINQVYNMYRENHGIPFPEEMVLLRNKYGLSAQKMSQILGLGINTYSNYEKGEIPSLANSKLINSAKRPEILLSYLDQTKDIFAAKVYEKLVKKIQESIDNDVDDPSISNFNWLQTPNTFSGYSIPNKEKISNLLIYLISNSNPDYNDRLKLNKMLFYIDFINYKKTGKSITGLSYRAILYGPVPANYDFIFAYFTEKERIIESEFLQSKKSRVIECFKTLQEFDSSIFDKEELDTIHKIVNLFKDTPSWDLVELSHKERAWIELNSSREVVSYQEYAFDTNEITERY